MIGIIIVAHGNLAREYLSAVEHVIGPQPNIKAVPIYANDDMPERQAEICAAVNEVDQGAGVVIASDLHGSSPFNLSCKACGIAAHKVISGVNVPLLLKLHKLRKQPLDSAIAQSIAAAREHIKCL